MIVKLVITVVAAALLWGCSAIQELPPRGQTPWDPKQAASLIDQTPNNTNSSDVCAGHIRPEQRKSWQTDRC
jgi:hypothetical protein